MALPSCKRCGKKDPQRMHGLMSLWFGPLVKLEADLGYFYLCPECHDELIVPELERIQNRILELHPAAQRHLEEMGIQNERHPPVADPGTGEAREDGGGDADTSDDDVADDAASDRAAADDAASPDAAADDAASPGAASPDAASAGAAGADDAVDDDASAGAARDDDDSPDRSRRDRAV